MSILKILGSAAVYLVLTLEGLMILAVIGLLGWAAIEPVVIEIADEYRGWKTRRASARYERRHGGLS